MTDRTQRTRLLRGPRFRTLRRRRGILPIPTVAGLLWLIALGSSALLAQVDDGGPFLVVGELRADDWTPIVGTVELVHGLSNHAAADLLEHKAKGRPPKPVATARSNADGSFELVAPRPGIYWIHASAPGYATIQRNQAFLSRSRKVDPLRLPAAMVRTFRIEDPDGNPISGAMLRVALGRDLAKPSDAPISAVGRSNAQGRVDLELAVGERAAQIDVVADGYVPGATRNISADALRDDWSTVTLLPGQARDVSVTVDGKPFPNARILLEGGRLPVARTGEQGEATVWVPPNATTASPMPLVAEAEGLHRHFGVAHRGDTTAALRGPAAEVVHVAARMRTLRGVVVDTENEPVPDGWLWTNRPFGETVRTDDRGHFALPVDASYPTDDHETQIAVAVPGMEAEFFPLSAHERIVLERPRRGVRVRVSDLDGNPVDGVRIEAFPNFTDRNQLHRFVNRGLPITETDSSGRGTLHLPVDDLAFRVSARKPGFEHWDDIVPPPPAADPAGSGAIRTLDIVLRPGTVQAGWVVDEADVGVAGAIVALRGPPPQPRDHLRFAMDPSLRAPIAQVTTDGDGRFEIRDVPAQKVQIQASASGFAPTEVAGVDILDSDGELGTIVLSPGHAVEGVVVDDDRQPVPDVLIRVHRQDLVTFGLDRDEDTAVITDADGHFRKPDLAAGSYFLQIRQEGYRDVREQVDVPLSEPLVLPLLRGITVPVRLADPEGEPIEQAYVSWYETNRNVLNGRDQMIQGHGSAAEGSMEIPGLRPGTFSVTAMGPDTTQVAFELVVDPAGRVRVDHEQVRSDGRSLDVQMNRGLTLRGKVVGPDGEPVNEVRINRSRGGNRSLTDGEYRLKGLSPGPLKLTFRASGYAPHETQIEMRDADQVYDVTLERGWTLEGSVVDGSTRQPIAAATVRLTPLGEDVWYRDEGEAAVTDAAGRFALAGVAAGQFTATAKADGYAEARISPIDIDGPPRQLSFELTTGSRVFGVMTGRDDRHSEMQISLHLEAGQTFTTHPAYDGHYEFLHVPSGPAQISAGDQRAAPYFADVDIPESGELEHDIELGTNRITGTVLLGGEPYVGAQLASLAEGQRMGGASTITDEVGRFVLEGIADGLHDVLVMRDNLPIVRRSVDVFGDVDVTIEIELTRLTGRVVSAEGEPVSGALVTASSSNPMTTRVVDVRGGSTTTNGDGSFVLEVPADVDAFELSASAAGHPPGKSRWSRGEATRVDLVLPPSAGSLEIQWTDLSPAHGSISLIDATGDVVQSGFGNAQRGWRIDSARPGDWTVSVHAGLVVLSQPVRIGADQEETTTVAMTWPTTGRVRLRTNLFSRIQGPDARLRLLDGAGAEVAFPGANRPGSLGGALAQLYTGQPVEAPVGTWTLEQIRNGAVIARTTISVEPDRVTEITFDE